MKWNMAAWFDLLHPLIVGHQEGIGSVGEMGQHQGTRYWSIWVLICGDYSDIFEEPCTPPEGAIKHEIDSLHDSVPPAKR